MRGVETLAVSTKVAAPHVLEKVRLVDPVEDPVKAVEILPLVG